MQLLETGDVTKDAYHAHRDPRTDIGDRSRQSCELMTIRNWCHTHTGT
jgi:hypothetical protein